MSAVEQPGTSQPAAPLPAAPLPAAPLPDSPPPDRPQAVGPASIVAEIMRAYPATLAVFVRRRMHCPGCPMASFMTVAQAAAEYGLDSDELVRELRNASVAP